MVAADWALLGVLQHDRVTDNQVRAREARDLVVREVPRHDAEEHAERVAADERGALAGEKLHGLVTQDLGGDVGVVPVDVGGEVDLGERLLEGLPHLAHDERGQLVTSFGVQVADAAHECGALLGGGRP